MVVLGRDLSVQPGFPGRIRRFTCKSWDVIHLLQSIQHPGVDMLHSLGVQSGGACWLWVGWLKKKKAPALERREKKTIKIWGCQNWERHPVCYNSVKGNLFRLQTVPWNLHEGTDINKPTLPGAQQGETCMEVTNEWLWVKGLNIHEMWFLYQTNVFIILCNDSLDNNSLSSEGISIKMEESIKMLYARIYKLGNFLDYCNHLQNWLFQCGIDRFQHWSLTTSTFSDICSYWSLNQVTIPHPSAVLGLKVRQTDLKEAYNYEVSLVFRGDSPRLWG